MESSHTTVAVQTYLDELRRHAGDTTAAPVVRELLSRAANRLQLLCASMLHRSYPRLAEPPLNLRTEEMLGAVVERLMKAMRAARPLTVRQFFALANQHMRWELNDLARKLDELPREIEVPEGVVAPETSGSAPSTNLRRILAAIEALPDDMREVFELVRIQGLTHGETAVLLGVATKTVQRRLNGGLVLLADTLRDLAPPEVHEGA